EDRRLVDWFRALQGQFVEMENYGYASLPEIQQLSGVDRGIPLFETLLVFENYPVGKQQVSGELTLSDLSHFEATNYPLTVIVAPGDQLFIQFNYHKNQFDRSAMERLAGHFKTILAGVCDPANKLVSTLPLLPLNEVRLLEWNKTARDF